MSTDAAYIEVATTIDNHGDERRPRDLTLFRELRERIKEVAQDAKFAPLKPVVY